MATYPAEHVQWRSTQHSTNVTSVGWDCNGNMYVNFRDGRVYMYRGVSRQRVVAAWRSKSAGRYINRQIKPFFKAIRLAG